MTDEELTHGDLLTLRHEQEGDVHTLHLSGEFDLASEPAFMRELDHAMTAGARQVTIDLDRLEFMDSTGLRCLLFAVARSEDADTRVVATRPQGQIADLFERSGVSDRIEFVDARSSS